MEPPLFEGEPEHCSLCAEAGHTHDDHWLFQHEPVKALAATAAELERRTAWSNEQIAERDEVIRQAAELLQIARSAMGSFPPLQAKADAWLALPIVKAARGK